MKVLSHGGLEDLPQVRVVLQEQLRLWRGERPHALVTVTPWLSPVTRARVGWCRLTARALDFMTMGSSREGTWVAYLIASLSHEDGPVLVGGVGTTQSGLDDTNDGFSWG
jgi:hypothetical protein